jgi:hypothetical protein
MQLAGTVSDLDVFMAALPNVYPAAPPDISDFYGVYRQAVVVNGWGITVEGGKYTKPFWCGPSILPYGYYEMPGEKKE